MQAREIVNSYFFVAWLMEASVEVLETLRCLLLEPETRVTFEPWG